VNILPSAGEYFFLQFLPLASIYAVASSRAVCESDRHAECFESASRTSSEPTRKDGLAGDTEAA
jgi:hypothetical protein